MTAAIMTAPDPVAAQVHSIPVGALLFVYRASRDGNIVMELSGYEAGGEAVVVEAEIHSVRRGDAKPQRRSHGFPTRELARKFLDEAMITFEYMGCTIKDLSPA